MKMVRDVIDGGKYLLHGFRLIFLPGMRRFVVIPLLISITVFAALFYVVVLEISLFADWVLAQLPAWLDWLSWLLWPIFIIAALLMIAYTFVALTGLISAPFNAMLAQRVVRHLRGHSVQGVEQSVWREIYVSVVAELKKLKYFFIRALPLALLFLIPVVNVAAPFLWFLLVAWMLARDHLDIAFGLRGIPFHQQGPLLSAHRALVVGFGALTAILSIIPFLNLFIVPAAVAGATALWLERIDNNQS